MNDGIMCLFTESNRMYYECVRCPTAYHISSDKPLTSGGQWCLVPGSELVGGRYVLCPEHFQSNKSNTHHSKIHVPWCCVCEKGLLDLLSDLIASLVN